MTPEQEIEMIAREIDPEAWENAWYEVSTYKFRREAALGKATRIRSALRADQKRDLFRTGAFTLHSGSLADWIIDAEALTDTDLATLAKVAARVVGPFGEVEGVPRGGLRFATALSKYTTVGPLLIADDTLTTGTSMEERRAGRDAKGIAIFARGECPRWVTAMFTLCGNGEGP